MKHLYDLLEYEELCEVTSNKSIDANLMKNVSSVNCEGCPGKYIFYNE